MVCECSVYQVLTFDIASRINLVHLNLFPMHAGIRDARNRKVIRYKAHLQRSAAVSCIDFIVHRRLWRQKRLLTGPPGVP